MKQFGREERHGEVEDPVAEGDGRHQSLHGRHGDALAADGKLQLRTNSEVRTSLYERLRESSLLAPSGRQGTITPSHNLL